MTGSAGHTEPHGGVPTIILCGGRGTRARGISTVIPKPMLPVGGRPILWHIMKLYGAHGHTDFVLALGWLGEEIRKFFLHHQALMSDFSIEFGDDGGIRYLEPPDDAWRVTCLDTGVDALTGTRVHRASRHLDEGTIMVTYGDCVGDIDVDALLRYHRQQGRLATVTAVHPPGRFGELKVDDGGRVTEFVEKPQTSAGTISGGFMVFEREAIDRYIPADHDVMLEREPMTALVADGQLSGYLHEGFWQPMDTPREHELLNELWEGGKAPWKVWT
ncbi:MAG: NTP transferase domain-containing protein [Actinobacteria bacterium]|nr:NTP transferase domain-containing protein [Actinomycetota bacterium]